jgi:ADP-ribose pyrophosphatase
MGKKITNTVVFNTPWFDIEELTIYNENQPYYALKTLDYVSILALTNKKEVVLVKQYRPILNKITVEIPSGHIEKNQSPEEAAHLELLEETGYDALDLQLLGTLDPDVGRLSNKLWCFFTSNIKKRRDYEVEKGIIPIKIKEDKLLKLICEGKFNFALNISTIFLSILKDKISFTNSK